jgi:hypothetical protein
LQTTEIVQLAYHVPDIEIAARKWAERDGAGPFFIAENIPLDTVTYRGNPGALDHSSAYGQMGHLMVELVQQNDAAASVFADAPFGLHHAACFATDMDAELARLAALGCPTAMTARTSTGVRFSFADARATHGHYFEIYEDNPAIRGFYEMVRAAAEGWDGTDPVRRL